MDVGIGLPNAVPWTTGEQLTEFARPAEANMGAYEEAGCEELILFSSSSGPDQADLLADAAGL